MFIKEKVSGVILAGGLAKRMNYQDKGLINYNGRPMISYAITALSYVVDQLIINANRNITQYQQFGLPVVPDLSNGFNGPLAGILTAMLYTEAPTLIVLPCDSPLIQPRHLHKLLLTRLEHNADVAVAFDGKKLHPVFLAIRTNLQTSLLNYLTKNERKVDFWLKQQKMVTVDFSEEPNAFANINSMTELAELQEKNTTCI